MFLTVGEVDKKSLTGLDKKTLIETYLEGDEN